MKKTNKLKITYYVILAVTIVLNILYVVTSFKNGVQPNWTQFLIPYVIILLGLDDAVRKDKKEIEEAKEK